MPEQIIPHLSHFVSFRTIAGNKKEKEECLKWIQETFLKSKISNQKSNISGEVEECPYLYLPHLNAKLLWFAHFDVVPAEDEQFTLKQNGDKLIGRGAMDMKGNQLPFLMALKDAHERGEDPPVSVLLTSDEETAGQTIPKLLEDGTLKDIPVAFTPDTTDRIVLEHKGVLWAELICKGKGSHAAYPWDGENPIFLLAEALQKIQEAFPRGTKDDWQMTVTPTTLNGGEAQNQVPDEVMCGIDIRYPKDVVQLDVQLLVQDCLPEGCEIKKKLSADALKTDPNDPNVQLLKKIAEDVTGEEVIVEREHGGTDARYFSAKGIPAFLYGPKGEGLHSKYEWVSLQSLVDNYEINTRLLHELV